MKADATLPTCGVWDVDEIAYHADRTAESSTTLNAFRNFPPAYADKFLFGVEEEKTAPMVFGSALHTLVLEPQEFDGRFIAWPATVNDEPTNLRKTVHKQHIAALEAQAKADGKQLLPRDASLEALEGMAKAVHEHEIAGPMLRSSTARKELGVRFVYEGVQCKCRYDIIDTGAKQPIAVNLKTAADMTDEGISKALANYGYDMAAALYKFGCEQVFDVDPTMKFIFVGKTSHHLGYACCVRTLGIDSLAVGDTKLLQTVSGLKKARETGDWRPHDSAKDVVIDIPGWEISKFGVGMEVNLI